MIRKIDKDFNALSQKELQKFEEIWQQVLDFEWQSLDIKKLKNSETIFRVRMGSRRIIFEYDGTSFELKRMVKRDERTYK